MQIKRKLIAVTVLGFAAAGAGGAVAASKLSSSNDETKSVLNDAARELGVQPSGLSAALKKALSDRVDEAVEAGRLTEAEGAALKARINSGEFPLFGVPSSEHHPFGLIEPDPMGELSTAADYLGLTQEQLRDRLNSGNTLAQIADAQDKSVAGLVDKLVDQKKARIEEAVKEGRLTRTQADEILAKIREAVRDLVENGKLHFEYREDEPGSDKLRPLHPDVHPPDTPPATVRPIA